MKCEFLTRNGSLGRKAAAKGHPAGQWQSRDTAPRHSLLRPRCSLTLHSHTFHCKSRKFPYPEPMQLLGTACAFPCQSVYFQESHRNIEPVWGPRSGLLAWSQPLNPSYPPEGLQSFTGLPSSPGHKGKASRMHKTSPEGEQPCWGSHSQELGIHQCSQG